MRSTRSAALLAGFGLLVLLAMAAPASASLSSLKGACSPRDAADGNTGNGSPLPFTFCDDGVPAAGGTTPNPGAHRALPVPQRYGGDGFTGLPPKAPAEPSAGADGAGDVALDADLSLPRASGGSFPLIVLMHTCCSADKRNFEASTVDADGELWHYSNAWFASRGYAVLTYTSRGFVDANGHGSTGQTELDSRRYEVNDFQQLACLLAADPDLDPTQPGAQRIDPRRVVISGSSYGAGLSWMALTDPAWNCGPAGRGDIAMRLAAAAPKYGWTDLVHALIPNGAHMRDALPPGDPAAASSKTPLGMPRTSIVAALYGTGKAGDPRTGGRLTFSPQVDRGIACLLSTTPLEQNPLCTATGVVPGLIDEFLSDRSAYYQAGFFAALERRALAPVPVFSAGSSSSPLFGQVEHGRMAERLRRAVSGYPIQEHYGDVGDFTQNKAKEWGDVCGSDGHLCRFSDYPSGNLDRDPADLRRLGITTRLNRFLDHYAKPHSNPRERRPDFDVTHSLQICPANADAVFPADEPGERFTESRFDDLAPARLRLQASGSQTTTNKAAPNQHAVSADPIANFLNNGGRCPQDTSPAGPGVAVYDFGPLDRDVVMMGRTRVTVPHAGSGSDLQLDARLYELLSDGRQVLVDRGAKRLGGPNGTTVLDLQGNGWRFKRGNRLRLELTQDDDPYVKSSAHASTLTLQGAALDIPVREAGPDALVDAPELASDVHRNRSLPFGLEARSGEMAGVSHGEVEIRTLSRGRARRRARRSALLQRRRVTIAPMGTARRSSVRGQLGGTYSVRARLVDRFRASGEWSPPRVTVIPFDDNQRRILRYSRGWRRVRSAASYGKGISRTTRRGASLRLRFRGDRLYLVGRLSRRGGRALVTVGRRRRVVRFRARRPRVRQVVLRLNTRRRGVNRMRLKVLRGRVEIDGVGVRRR